MSVYDFSAKDAKGESISLSNYKGKVLLIVNTATACGFTPQYRELQELYLKHQKEGFEILDFPCNQFKNQAAGSDAELASFCELHYQTTFKTFGKIKVNGTETHPLFAYLKAHSRGFLGQRIKWNFTKFLIDRNGRVVGRFGPITSPSKIETALVELFT
ncbi:glutathione peroxidase [Flavobacterium sp. NKUCC04_CG]|uniref:glutathione peroxidase n=1 Tax=Flavobacterium sp. NKUCC04_CG TaxID=2842121 RepID=UPI001C5BA402|nr:glutathione peroxidase [Flavobacterium sp. NKUCC04_CG]MBW3518434.1 glutathione peroxidase [Flavobacterium sp. NKUCC04_CG]